MIMIMRTNTRPGLNNLLYVALCILVAITVAAAVSVAHGQTSVLTTDTLAAKSTPEAAPSPSPTPKPTPTPKPKPFFQITYLAVEVLPVTRRGTKWNEFSPQLGLRFGNHVSTFTLAEWGDNRGGLLNTAIVVRPAPKAAPWIFSKSEIIITKAGGVFQTGVGVDLAKVPEIKDVVGEVFKSLTISHYLRLVGRGNRGPNETHITWTTQSFGNDWLRWHSEGMWRIRGNGRKDVTQPQVWVTSPKLVKKIPLLRKVLFGAEAELSGGRWLLLPGIKFFPLQ